MAEWNLLNADLRNVDNNKKAPFKQDLIEHVTIECIIDYTPSDASHLFPCNIVLMVSTV